MAGMVVQHNMNALNAYNKLNVNVNGLKKSSEKLSSGYRINRAGDDAAGLAISEKMRSQIRGLTQAKRNSQDGISMIQTFEGAAQETHSILQRMKELASESANGTYDNATDRAAIQLEFDQLNDELNQIADTDFNGTVVLNGGQMADGLKEEGGEFNYANLDDQIAAERAKAPVDMVAKNDYSAKAPDLQDSVYVTSDPNDKTAIGAGKLWEQAATDGYAAAANSSTINIKYTVDTVDADGNVTAYKATYVDDNGKEVATYGGTLTVTKNGGLQDGTTGVNVIADTIGAKAGDFFTVKYTKPAGAPQGPTNAGAIDMYGDGKTGIVASGSTTQAALDHYQDSVAKNFKIVFEDEVVDDWVGTANSEIYQEAIEALDGAELSVTWTDKATASADLGAPTIKLTSSDGNSVDLNAAHTTNDTGWAVDAKPAVNDSSVILYYKNVKIGTITFGDPKASGLSTDAITVKSTIAVDGYRLPSDAKNNASLIADKSTKIDKTVSNANSCKNSTARLTYAKNITLQTGARSKDSVNFTFNYNADKTADMGNLKANLNISAREDGLNTENLSLATQGDANYAIDQIDKAINKVSMVRASFGSIQNRLEHKIENLTTTTENLTEAESTIRDTDMASEMLNYTKYNILQQAAQSMLAQANQQPQSVLQLLG